MQYKIYELQNLYSFRTPEIVDMDNLQEVQHYAGLNRKFQSTVLVIEDMYGHRLATKMWGEDWTEDYQGSQYTRDKEAAHVD